MPGALSQQPSCLGQPDGSHTVDLRDPVGQGILLYIFRVNYSIAVVTRILLLVYHYVRPFFTFN